MTQFITIAKLVLSLFPLIISAVKSLDEAFPQAQIGALKLDVVKASLEGAYSAANEAEVKFETVWPALAGTAAAVVKLFKSVKG